MPGFLLHHVEAEDRLDVDWRPGAHVQVHGRREELSRRSSSVKPQRDYGLHVWYEERRDNFFTTAVRLHVRPRAPIDIEPVLGFDVVKEEAWHASDREPYPGGPVSHAPRYKPTLPAVAGFAVGADVRVGRGHVAFVASFRVHRTFWGGGDFDETKPWTLRPGAGLRVSF